MRIPAIPLLFLLFPFSSVAWTSEPNSLAIAALENRVEPGVLVDRDGEGTLWALGTTWKMRFGSDRTVYHPRFGERAPRTPSLDVTLAGATVGGTSLPLVRGAASDLVDGRVHYDRGAFVETWVLTPTTVEQTFVLAAPLGPGELVLEFGSGSDLSYTGRDALGLRFELPGVGSIRYGDVTLIDAIGHRTQLSSQCAGDRIVLRVPAEVLATAAYPLSIDPLIENLAVDVDSQDDEDPDAAFAGSRYLVVYERVISATDRDIISRRYEADGDLLEELGVDLSDEDTVDPAVAGSNSDFMIVWNQLADGSIFSDNEIRGRRRIGGSTVQGAAFEISTGARDEQDPDVGGTPNLVARPFFVVWTEDPLIGGAETHGRAIDALGNDLGSDVFFGLGNLVDGPRISKSAGTVGRYVVIWETIGTEHRFLDAQLVSHHGSKVGSLVVVDQKFHPAVFHADVDGDGTNFVVVRESSTPSFATDLVAKFLTVNGSGVLAAVIDLNFTALENGGSKELAQTFPAIASEGGRFTIAYLQPEGTGLSEVRTSTIVANMEIPIQSVFVETTQVHGVTGSGERDLSVVSTQFKEPGEVLLTWTRDVSAANSQIEGARRSTLLPGGVVTVQTGCGSPEPILLGASVAATGGAFSLLIGNTASSTPLVAIGTPFPAPIPLCSNQAPGCLLGVNAISVIALPTVVGAAIPCAPALLGFTAAVQVIDVLPSNASGTFCGPPKYAQKFKVSDTLRITFQ